MIYLYLLESHLLLFCLFWSFFFMPYIFFLQKSVDSQPFNFNNEVLPKHFINFLIKVLSFKRTLLPPLFLDGGKCLPIDQYPWFLVSIISGEQRLKIVERKFSTCSTECKLIFLVPLFPPALHCITVKIIFLGIVGWIDAFFATYSSQLFDVTAFFYLLH